MAGTLMLINPRGRHRRRRNRMPAALARYWAHHGHHRRRARASNPHRRRRRRNVIVPTWYATNRRRVHHRRRNPHVFRRRRHHHYRRNPTFGFRSGFMRMISDAATMGAGAIALDYVYGFVNARLPANLQRTPGSIGVGDAVKILFNVMIGTGPLLGRFLPRGARMLAHKAAVGSMTVHMYQLISQSLPTNIQAGLAGSLGWWQPAPTIPGTQWITPNRSRMVRHSPLLSGTGMIVRGGSATPLLSSIPSLTPQAPTLLSVAAGVPIK